MTNEQRAILAAWNKAVAAWRNRNRDHRTVYNDAVVQFYLSVDAAGYDMFSFDGPGGIAHGS